MYPCDPEEALEHCASQSVPARLRVDSVAEILSVSSRSGLEFVCVTNQSVARDTFTDLLGSVDAAPVRSTPRQPTTPDNFS